ncbi:MAG TPA: hypothetical protein PLP50_05330 [Thermoanaerobaculia bacterium]|jgi:hypothetical protein|nr:hypothetical protein [Thermoanaerobaculia bacterium]HPA51008.1 hypothetical protein [Thermoanaerobaculia bacterium]HQN06236.1 hypothetical protein [Thermoanaerobaculia bacterium]HQP86119.1 hypothetical protein [Thermoanaerobaculia bacterium]
MFEAASSSRFQGGLLPRRTFLALLAFASLLGPLLVFRETVRDPLERIPCGRPVPNERLGDPVIVLSVMGRQWARWDSGDFSRRDDRVFAPYPDTWPLGEPFLLPSAIGYPWSRLADSDALGYNVPYFLATAVACFAAGLLCADLVGPGWAALIGALLLAWSPGRLNNFGVLGTIWAGFVSLVLLFALRYLRSGRVRDAAACAAALLVVGLGSPYPLVMGTVSVAVVAAASARSFRRPVLLGVGGSAAIVLLAVAYAPYLHLARDFDAPVGLRSIEVHAADLLSILHTGVFAGPLRDLLDGLVPVFPEGASALFPTLTALAAFGAGAFLLRRRGPWRRRDARHAARSLAPWLLLAGISFVFALGPTIRFAGRALGPGPYALLAQLPGFSGMRGIHRWDQWFGLGVIVTATLVLGRLLRALPARRGRLLLVGVAPLLVLDLWTRPVPAQPVPAPSPFDAELRALPRDAIVAVWPFRRGTSERSWAEQLSHRRRVLNGFQTYPPPIHFWLDSFLSDKPFEAAFAAYSELGVAAIEVDLEAAPRGSGERLGALLASGALPGVRAAMGSRSRLLLLLEPKAPILVDPRTIEGLSFEGDSAVVARAEGRLLFRLGSGRLAVVVESPAGPVSDVLRIPVVGAGELGTRLSRSLPPGAVVRAAADGREIGRTGPPPSRPPSG